MANKIFPFSIKMGLVDKVSAPMRRASESVSGMTGKLKKMNQQFKLASKEAGLGKRLDEMKKNAKGLGLALGAVAGITTGLVFSFANTGDELDKTASKLGVSIEFLQKMQFAGKKSGVNVETLNMALQRFGRRVGEASAGTGEAKTALEALGISVFDATGNVRDLESLMPEVADRLSEIENANVRNALAMKFFDSEGVKLVNTLKDGSSGLNEYFKQAEKYGLITEESTKASADFKNAMTDLSQAGMGFKNDVIGPMLPPLTEFIAKTTDFFANNRQDVKKWGGAFTDIVGTFIAFKGLKLAGSIIKVAAALRVMGLATLFAGGPITAIVAGILGLIAAVKIAKRFLAKNKEEKQAQNNEFNQNVQSRNRRRRSGAAATAADQPQPESATEQAAAIHGAGRGRRRGIGGSGKISVDFNNMPQGSKARIDEDDGMNLQVSQGFALL